MELKNKQEYVEVRINFLRDGYDDLNIITHVEKGTLVGSSRLFEYEEMEKVGQSLLMCPWMNFQTDWKDSDVQKLRKMSNDERTKIAMKIKIPVSAFEIRVVIGDKNYIPLPEFRINGPDAVTFNVVLRGPLPSLSLNENNAEPAILNKL